ncbi:MAG: cytidylate kinase-like family protein [Pseudomonadota bacterium]
MAHSALEALIRQIEAVAYDDTHVPAVRWQSSTVVTISGAPGSGGDAIARDVAAALDVPLYDREILEEVARASGIDRRLLERLDESVSALKGAWLRAILTGENVFKDSYRRNLVNAILSIAAGGGVIIGRGANLVLGDEQAFRVRIVGSEASRVGRMARDGGVELAKARSLVTVEDRKRSDFIRTLFGRDINDPINYDLVLNSDRLDRGMMVELILAASGASVMPPMAEPS